MLLSPCNTQYDFVSFIFAKKNKKNIIVAGTTQYRMGYSTVLYVQFFPANLLIEQMALCSYRHKYGLSILFDKKVRRLLISIYIFLYLCMFIKI